MQLEQHIPVSGRDQYPWTFRRLLNRLSKEHPRGVTLAECLPVGLGAYRETSKICFDLIFVTK